MHADPRRKVGGRLSLGISIIPNHQGETAPERGLFHIWRPLPEREGERAGTARRGGRMAEVQPAQGDQGAGGAAPTEPVDYKAKYEEMRGHMREWEKMKRVGSSKLNKRSLFFNIRS